MKTWLAIAIGTVPALASGVALAQNGNMMNDGGWGMGWMGGYGGGGALIPILLVVAIAGLVVWIIKQKSK